MRMLLRVLTTVLLLLLALPRPCAAAPAAPSAQKIEAHLGQITLAPSGPEKIMLLWVRLQPAAPDSERHLEVTVDFGAAAAFADLDLETGGYLFVSDAGTDVPYSSAPDDGPCRRSETTFACEWDDMLYDGDELTPVALFLARPTKAAKTGDSAQIVTRARVGHGEWTTSESVVRIGESVDLDAGDDHEISAAPGRPATATPVVHNAGATPIDGTYLYVDSDARLLAESSYRNCRYDEGAMLCEFDTALEPGRSYALSSPITLSPPADSVAGSRGQAIIQWITKTELDDWAEFAPFPGAGGTGEPLTLRELVSAQSEPQADVRQENDFSRVNLTVTGPARPDLAAVGARHTVAVGDEILVEVGVRNLGPGTLHPDLFPNNAVTARVVVPGNVRVNFTYASCQPTAEGDSDAREYLCRMVDTLAPRSTATFGFDVNIERRRGDAGSIEVAEASLGSTAAKATGRANDVARIVLTVPAPATPTLPITGPTLLGPVAAGLALVLSGLLLAVWRTRRPRPVPR